MQHSLNASVIRFLRNASWKVSVPVVLGIVRWRLGQNDRSADRVIEEGMRCISRRVCDNGVIGRERKKERDNFPDGRLPLRLQIWLESSLSSQAQRLLSLSLLYGCRVVCLLSVAVTNNPGNCTKYDID